MQTNQKNKISYPKAFKKILHTASFFSLARLIQVLSDFGSVALLAQLGTVVLAASNVITSTQTLALLPLMSIYNALIIIIRPKDPLHAGKMLYQSWQLSILLSVPAILFCLFSTKFIFVSDNIHFIITRYFDIFVFSIPFYLGLYANQQFAISIGKPSWVFISSAINAIFTIGFSYIFIFGKFGFTALGVSGLAYGNTLSTVLTFIACSLYLLKNYFQKQQLSFQATFDKNLLLTLFTTGLPIGIYVGTEIAAIYFATLLVSFLGHNALAAQQAAAAYLYIFTSLLIAGSQAAAADIRKEIWLQNFTSAIRLSKTAMTTWVIFAIIIASIMFFMPKQLLSLFLNIHNPHLQPIFQIAISLLKIHAIGLIFDAIRNLASGCLRAYGDVKTPMILGIISNNIFALILAYILGFPLHFGVSGIFIARDCALGLSAVILLQKCLRYFSSIGLST